MSEQLSATRDKRFLARKRRRVVKKILSVVLPISGILGLFVIWGIYVKLSGVPSWQLSAPIDVINMIITKFSDYLPHLWKTFYTIGIGWAIACTVGITLATFMSNIPILSTLLTPYINFLCVLPIIAVLPMMYAIAGATFRIFLLAIVMQSFAINILNSSTGFLNVPILRTELMLSLRASKPQQFFKCTFPSSLSYVFTGMKMSSIFATTTCVSAEMTGSKIGLGAYLLTCKNYGRTAEMLGAFLLISVIGVFYYLLIDIFQGLFIKWRE